MAWESVRDDLLRKLCERIDKRSEADHQQDLHNLMAVFYGRYPPDDMRGRSVENLYGCFYGLLRFMNKWPKGAPKVRILNPEVQSHGWETKSTVIIVLCRDMPFCVASVRGDLTEKQRNLLLEEMTDSVAKLVLQNNYRQVQAISLVEFEALDRGGEHRRFISNLVAGGKLDRALEFLPSDEEMLDRRAHVQGLTRPELSVLVSYSKAILKEDLIDSDLGKDFFLATAVLTAFPPRLISEYEEEIRNHRLHREIMCTQIANDIVNRMGLNFVARQVKATGAPIADVARAYTTVIHVFGISDIWSRIEALDHQVDSRVQMEMMLNLIRLIKPAVRWLLRNRRHQMAPTGAIEEFADGVEQLREALPTMLRGGASEQCASLVQHYIDEGVSAELAAPVAGTLQGYTVLGVIQAATETESPLLEVAQLYFFMGERLELDWFSGQILTSKVENEWQATARDTYLEDLEWQQRTLAVGVLRYMCEDRDLIKCLQAWELEEADLLTRWHEMLAELHSTDVPDFAMYAVANRELLELAQSSLG